MKSDSFRVMDGRLQIQIPENELKVICEKWGIARVEVFGSVLTTDFNQNSDIDVMVTFAPNRTPGLGFITLKQTLEQLLNRPVDLVTRNAIEQTKNPRRREEILTTARAIYEKKAA